MDNQSDSTELLSWTDCESSARPSCEDLGVYVHFHDIGSSIGEVKWVTNQHTVNEVEAERVADEKARATFESVDAVPRAELVPLQRAPAFMCSQLVGPCVAAWSTTSFRRRRESPHIFLQ